MIIAVASGKGGTGKTTVSAALARVWPGRRLAVDLDVEAPNLHLFLKPRWQAKETVSHEVPVVEPDKCDGCGACRDICAFQAVAVFGRTPLVFPEMCHACGGCLAVCTRGALIPGARDLGVISCGVTADGLPVLSGRLTIGESVSSTLIRHIRRRLREMRDETGGDVIVDAPPGTSCPAIEAVRDADAVVLVTEPTPFGLYDLDLAYRAFATLDKPMAVLINRAGKGDERVHAFCAARRLPVLDAIPLDRRIAEAYARGLPLDAVGPAYAERVRRLAGRVRAFAAGRPVRGLADA